MVVSGDDVYAGGYNTNNSPLVVPGYWKNESWTGLVPPNTARGASLLHCRDDVYTSGIQTDVLHPLYWKITPHLPKPLDVTKIHMLLAWQYPGKMYVGGYSTNSSNVGGRLLEERQMEQV